jgi:hypothetical protein
MWVGVEKNWRATYSSYIDSVMMGTGLGEKHEGGGTQDEGAVAFMKIKCKREINSFVIGDFGLDSRLFMKHKRSRGRDAFL